MRPEEINKHYGSDEGVKKNLQWWSGAKHIQVNFTKQGYMVSFKRGIWLLREIGTMLGIRDGIHRKLASCLINIPASIIFPFLVWFLIHPRMNLSFVPKLRAHRWDINLGNRTSRKNSDSFEEQGCNPLMTSFALIHVTVSCVGNYHCTKEKGITFWLTLVCSMSEFLY